MWLFLACVCDVSNDAPEWYPDVLPIVERRCENCHTPELNRISFSDASGTVALAPAMAAAIRAGTMPPAAPDPECRGYMYDEELEFTDEERQTILDWADGGAPLGDADAAAHAEPLDIVPEPDVVLEVPVEHVYDFTENEEYLWCFDTQLDIDEDIWLTSITVDPDDAPHVHHVVLFQVLEGESVDHYEGGTTCDIYGEFPRHIDAGWAGGAWPVTFPEGTGLKVPAGTTFVFQVHFEGKAEDSGGSARPSAGLTYSTMPEHELIVLDEPGPDFVVPADDDGFSLDLAYTWTGKDAFHAVTAGGHMHQLGSALTMNHEGPAGSECMIDSTPWDFHRQVFLTWDEPVVYEHGDEYGWRCTWDNTSNNPFQYNSPPVDIEYGLDVHQEMCSAATFGWTK